MLIHSVLSCRFYKLVICCNKWKSNIKLVERGKIDTTNKWPLTFLAWHVHFNKRWRGSTSFMSPCKSFNTCLIYWLMLVDAITYMYKEFHVSKCHINSVIVTDFVLTTFSNCIQLRNDRFILCVIPTTNIKNSFKTIIRNMSLLLATIIIWTCIEILYFLSMGYIFVTWTLTE